MTNFPSLELAQIVSVECYGQRSVLGAIHRFLVLHLRRPDRSDTYLRLDHRRARTLSLGIFGKGDERQIADDTVRIEPFGVYSGGLSNCLPLDGHQ